MASHAFGLFVTFWERLMNGERASGAQVIHKLDIWSRCPHKWPVFHFHDRYTLALNHQTEIHGIISLLVLSCRVFPNRSSNPSKSLTFYHAAAAIQPLNYGNFNTIKQPPAAWRLSSTIWWISDTPGVSLSLTHPLIASSKHQPRLSTRGTKSPVLGNDWPISCPSLNRARIVMFHLLCEMLNVTLWCLLALKFPSRGMWGNFSPSESSLPRVLCANSPFLWLQVSALTFSQA